MSDPVIDSHEMVTLANGKSVVVERWSWVKMTKLVQIVFDTTRLPEIVHESVRPEDRPKLEGISNVDMARLGIVALRVNEISELSKNVVTLGAAMGKATEGMGQNTPSRKPAASSPAPASPPSPSSEPGTAPGA